jgi:hypothetical protein
MEARGDYQLIQHRLDVRPGISGLGESCRVDDHVRDIEIAGDGLDHERLAGAGRPDHQDIRFLDLGL